jgi:hypothetical protein
MQVVRHLSDTLPMLLSGSVIPLRALPRLIYNRYLCQTVFLFVQLPWLAVNALYRANPSGHSCGLDTVHQIGID